MRRDVVTQVIVTWENGYWENFPTPLEAQFFINDHLDDLGVPIAAWLEDMQGKKKWDYTIIELAEGILLQS